MSNVLSPFAAATEPFYSVRLSYLTDVITADDGTEQRMMLRIIPVREHSFLVRTYQSFRSGWLDSLTYGNQNSQLAVPEWPHGGFLTTAVTAGSAKVLNIQSTASTDFAIGGYAVLWNDEGRSEEVTVTAVSGTSITADVTLGWAAGTFVMPSHKGNYSGSLSIARQAGFQADLPVTLTMEHGADPEVATPESALVFSTVPYMRVDVSHDLTRQVERLESPTYTFADYQTGDAPIGRRPFKVWLASRSSVSSLIAWFHSLRGRSKTFYLPTYQADLDALSGLGTTTVTIKRCGYSANMFPMASRKIIAAVSPNGTVTKCTVLTATDNGVATNTETLTFDVAPPANSMLSYLLYGRLESDTLEIQWRTNGFADCTMGFIETPAELAPTEFEVIPDDDQNVGAPNPPAGPAVAGMTTAVVPNGQDEVPTLFTVTARDANGIRLTSGGATVAASVTGANTATPTITDLENGQYRGTYTPTNTGTDSVAITYNGSPIKNSPYTSIVSSTPVDIPNAMPFGFWSADNAAEFAYGPMTFAIRSLLPGSVMGWLNNVDTAGLKGCIVFSRDEIKDSAGRFSVARWKAEFDQFHAVSGLAAKRTNGTLDMLCVADDVTAAHYGGVKPTIAQLSECCAYSKNLWPTVKTMIRTPADRLAGITSLDYAGCQYERPTQDVTAYRSAQETAARANGFRIVFGLNSCNGGNGESGFAGTTNFGNTGWAMSASEITRYGKVLLASDLSDYFTLWRLWNSETDRFFDYYHRTDIQNAVEGLADLAAGEVR
jgi:hypothetical protein